MRCRYQRTVLPVGGTVIQANIWSLSEVWICGKWREVHCLIGVLEIIDIPNTSQHNIFTSKCHHITQWGVSVCCDRDQSGCFSCADPDSMWTCFLNECQNFHVSFPRGIRIFLFFSGNGLCEPVLLGACVLKTTTLVLDVIEKMKCVWQRNVHRFALCVETA